MLVEGEMEIEMNGTVHLLEIGKEFLIPAHTFHTVRIGANGKSRWLYAYKHA
jgi:glyoxylate utilization-related uncharacterized protein